MDLGSLLDRFHRPRRSAGLSRPVLELPAAATELSVRAAPSEHLQPQENVPLGVRTAAGWAWRALVLAAAVLGIGYVLAYFSAVTVPLAVAILLTALLHPLIDRMRAWGLPRLAASIIAVVAVVVLIAGIGIAIGSQVAREAPDLVDKTIEGTGSLLTWLAEGPLHIDRAQIEGWISQLTTWAATSQSEIAGALAKVGAQVGHFLAGTAIALVATFFFGFDGRAMWTGAMGLLPAAYREPAARAGERGWQSLVSYMRATVLVAFVDALGVLIAALVLGIPMPWALFALTFVVSFVPVVGAVTAGFVAVVLALVTNGWVNALLMLVAVVLVMELESHFLQPLLLGKAVSVHPLAVLLGIAVGSTLSGIVGALMAIPVLAFGVAFVNSLRSPVDQAHGARGDAADPARSV